MSFVPLLTQMIFRLVFRILRTICNYNHMLFVAGAVADNSLIDFWEIFWAMPKGAAPVTHPSIYFLCVSRMFRDGFKEQHLQLTLAKFGIHRSIKSLLWDLGRDSRCTGCFPP